MRDDTPESIAQELSRYAFISLNDVSVMTRVIKVRSCISILQENLRGPDFSSYYEQTFSDEKFMYLLHSRLSIIDLKERSNQPSGTD